MSKNALLFGGGLDSWSILELCYGEGDGGPLLIYVDWGAKAMVGELQSMERAAKRYGCDTKVIEIADALNIQSALTNKAVESVHAKNFVPYRNLMFASMALVAVSDMDVGRIQFGFHIEPEGSNYADAKKPFLILLNSLLISGYPEQHVYFHAPLIDREREDYIGDALNRYPDLFDHSFSCYEAITEFECGMCTHCLGKQALLKKLRLKRIGRA